MKIPYFSKYFSTMSLTIVTRKLKLLSMCSQNKMFKHPKLKTMTQLSPISGISGQGDVQWIWQRVQGPFFLTGIEQA